MAIINKNTTNEFHKDSIIPKAIRKGSGIKVKHYSSFEPITRAVLDIEGNRIITDLPEKLLDNTILTGDSVVCIFFDQEVEYVLSGEVSDISLLVPHKMTIKIENIEKHTNQRKQPRYSVSLSANVKTDDFSKIGFAVVKNISLLGVSMVCKKELSENSEVQINIAVSSDVIITASGKIVRKRELENFYEYGLSLTKIDEFNKEELDKYINHLESEEARMFESKME